MGCSTCGRKYPGRSSGPVIPGPQPTAPYINPNRRVSVNGVVRSPVKQVAPQVIVPPKSE